MKPTEKESGPARKVSFKDRQRQHREEAIIETARELMRQKGYAAMSIEDVIGAVGISKPTFYGHFVGKEELGVKVLLKAMRYGEEYLAKLSAELPPREAVRAMIAWAIDRHYGADNEYEFGGAMELFKQVDVRAAENALADAISAVIQKGQDEGSIRKDVPALLLGQTFHSILKDAAHDEAYRAGTLDVEALKANVVKLLLE